jgi:N-acetylated-alpha-linked acidic dipeptidase
LLGFTPAAAAEQRAREARFSAGLSRRSLSDLHRRLTRQPHVAGTAASLDMAEWIRHTLHGFGLEVEVADYEAYLSHARRVRLALTAPDPAPLSVDEPPAAEDPDTAHPALGPGFVAYAASGDATGPVVYANYGLPADYVRLRQAGIDPRGKIVLARYARSHRAVKVHTAEAAGAAGIVIYSDPADDGAARGEAWPAGPWRPEWLLQRGNAKYSWFWHGDPLTPGVAATANAARLDPATAPTLPRIPAAVLSAREAEKVLRRLGGDPVPAEFQGGLPFTYRLGPGPARVRLAVQMNAGSRRVRNVLGRIPGRQADRLVLLGTHHDAWTFGGVDPGGSAAVVLEVARALGTMRRAGWTPERSIVFAFWDAEEFGLVGSTEYAEEHQSRLREQAVAYVNTDLYMEGRLDAGGVPSLRDFVAEVLRDVPEGPGSLLDAWRESEWRRLPADRRTGGRQTFRPELAALGSGADFVPFQDHLGLPTLSVEFDFPGSYGTYHSNHDTRRYFERFADPGFRRGETLARVLGLIVMRLAEAPLLPLRYSHYAERIGEFLRATERGDAGAGPPGVRLDLNDLRAQAAAVEREAAGRERALDATLAEGRVPAQARAINDALARAEQALLDESEPARERWYRHVVYGWNVYSLYDGQPLPGLAEAIRHRDAPAVERERRRIAGALARLRAALGEVSPKSP